MHLCVLLVCSLLSLSRQAKAQPLVLCMLCRHLSLLPSAFAATLRGMLQRLPKEQSSSPSSASPPLPPSLRLSHTCPCQDMTTRGSTLSNKRQWSRCLCVFYMGCREHETWDKQCSGSSAASSSSSFVKKCGVSRLCAVLTQQTHTYTTQMRY